jgi:predicted transcriptional regulator
MTNEEIDKAFENTNFGSRTPKQVINESLLQYAIGYSTGRTSTLILQDLGLIQIQKNKSVKLTAKGRSYFYNYVKSLEKSLTFSPENI